MKKVITILVLVAALQLAVVSATSAAPAAWGGGGGNHHRVSFGETLSSIGRMYNADPQCIANANGLWNPNLIFAGQVLFIPASCSGPVMPPCGPGCGQVNHPWGNNCNWGNSWGCTTTTVTTCTTCGSSWQGGWQNPCPNCGWQRPVPFSGFGYDYTGYFYSSQSSSYSHTCGYFNNCW